MTRILFSLLLLACGAVSAATLEFDDERYTLAEVQRDDAGLRNYYLRDGESMQRYSRMVRVTEIRTGDDVPTLARATAALARMRPPGMQAETFSPDGRERSDITVAWLQVPDGVAAIEYHVVRYVQRGKSVLEYGFVIRRYLNDESMAAAMEQLGPFAVTNLPAWVADIGALDLVPAVRKD